MEKEISAIICNFCSNQLNKDYPNVYGFFCPNCGEFNDPDNKDFPIYIRQKENKAKYDNLKNEVIRKVKHGNKK